MTAKFAIFRRESSGGYSTRGPIVPPMTLPDARKEIAKLKATYPYQDFVIMGEIGEVTRSERVTVKIEAPDLSTPKRKRRKAAFEDDNVIPIRKDQTA